MSSIILNHANVITMDPDNPTASIVAVRGDRITYVGNHFDEAMDNACTDCRVIDMSGKTVIPGFNDNHAHLLSMADFYSLPRLRGMKCQEIIDYLCKTYRDIAPGEPVFAMGWDFPTCEIPHKSQLDEVFPDNPVYLIQFSGHGAWVNSRALKVLRIGRRTRDPRGGQIVRDKTGEATGILFDTAVNRIHEQRIKRMNFNKEVRATLMEKALDLFNRAGVTTVQDNTWIPGTFRYFKKVRDNGRLTLRISCWAMGFRPFIGWLMKLQHGDDLRVRRGPWKHFMDGTFSTRTALMHDSYPDQPGNTGLKIITDRKLYSILIQAARQRRQLAFHAIGDKAVTRIVDTVEKVAQRYPAIKETRLRIEHGQIIRREDLDRIRNLGIIIAAQPTALGTPEKDRVILGEDRARSAYPYRTIIDAGIPLSFGSDIPGEIEYQPLVAIQNAVNRQSPEKISAEEALRAYTMGSAYAEFLEEEKGSITPGKLADITVLSDNLLKTEPSKIADIDILMTITGGTIVYSSMGSFS
jgi:predicted amidohydrolase YtcJ